MPESLRDSTSSRNPELVTSSRLSKLDSSKLENPERKRNKIQDQQDLKKQQDPRIPTPPNFAEASLKEVTAMPIVDEVAAYFRNRLQEAGMRTFPQTWAQKTQRRVRQMCDDGWTVDDLKALIEWCFTHPFWRNKVTSMDKVADLVGEWQLQSQGVSGGTNFSHVTEAGRHQDSGALDALVIRAHGP